MYLLENKNVKKYTDFQIIYWKLHSITVFFYFFGITEKNL